MKSNQVSGYACGRWVKAFTLLLCCCQLFTTGTSNSFHEERKTSVNGETCRIRPIDVVFVIDGSRSVRPHHFLLVKNFVKNFTEIFDQLGPKHLQIGVIQYGSRIREEIRLDQFYNKADLDRAIDNIKYMQTGTMTGRALKHLVTQTMTPKRGSRWDDPIVHHLAVVITDGRSQDYSRGTVTKWQRKAKNKGIELIAIGVGRRANDRELEEIASSPKAEHKFHVSNFETIYTVNVNDDHKWLCDVDECAVGNHSCSQICNNTIGSYVCSCYDGYSLQADQFTCLLTIIPAPTNLRFTQITHTSAQAQWEMRGFPEKDVDHYILSYTPALGNGAPIVVRVNGRTSPLVNLDPSVKYNVSVKCVSKTSASSDVEGSFTTLSLGGTSLTLNNPELTTLTANWEPAGGDRLTGYEIQYGPKASTEAVSGGRQPQLMIKRFGPDTLQTVLTNLQPGTKYIAHAIPLYGNLVGRNGSDEQITAFPAPIPRNLEIFEVTHTSAQASWEIGAFPENDIDHYLLSYVRADGTGQKNTIRVSSRTTAILNLEPSVKYNVSVISVTSFDSSSPAQTNFKTLSLGNTSLTLSNPTLSSLTADWTAAGGDGLTGYEISYQPKQAPNSGGVIPSSPVVKRVGPDVLQTTLADLQSGTLYAARVTPLYGSLVGGSGADEKRTVSKAPTPIDLLVANVTHTTARVSWRIEGFPEADVDHYLVSYALADGSGPETSIRVPGKKTTVLMNLDPAKKYRVSVACVTKHDTSPPVKKTFTTLALGETTLTLSKPTMTTLSAKWTAAGGDGLTGYQIRYQPKQATTGNAPKPEPIIRNVSSDVLQLTLDGLQPATTYTAQVFPFYGSLVGIHGSDEAVTASPAPTPRNLRFSQITYTSARAHWSIGDFPAEDVDYYELSYIRADGQGQMNVLRIRGNKTRALVDLDPAVKYNVSIFSVTKFDRSPSVDGTFTTLALGDTVLTLSNPTLNTLEANWEPAGGDGLTGYEITYEPTAPVDPGQADRAISITRRVGPDVHQIILSDLLPGTAYTARVTPLYGDLIGARGADEEVTVVKAPTPTDLKFSNVTHTSTCVGWKIGDFPEEDVDYYVVSYRSADGNGKETVVEVRGNKTCVLSNLDPSTKYIVSVSCVTKFDRSPPIQGSVTTLSLGQTSLTLSDPTLTTLQADWTAAGGDGLTGYKLKYRPKQAQGSLAVKPVSKRFGPNVLQSTLENLQPQTKYVAVVTPLYGALTGGSASDEETTATPAPTPSNLRSSQITHTSSRIDWEIGDFPAEDVDHFILSYVPADGSSAKVQLSINGSTTADLVGLDPSTTYNVTVTCITKFDVSPPANGGFTTLSLGATSATLTNATLTTLTLSWEPAGGDGLSGYEIRFMPKQTTGSDVDDPLSVPVIRRLDPDVQQIILTGLRPATFYVAKVFPLYGKLVGQNGVAKETTASPAPTPSNLMTSKIQYTSAFIAWDIGDFPEADVDYYVLSYVPSDGSAEKVVLRVEGKQSSDLTILDPSVKYNVSVSSVTKFDTSPPVEGSFMTPSLGSTVVTLSNPTLTTLTASWLPAGGDGLTDYEISYKPKLQPGEGSSDAMFQLVGADVLQTDLVGLEPGTLYTVDVAPLYGFLVGGKGTDEEMTALLAPTPFDLSFTQVSHTTACVGWSIGDFPGDVDHYLVTYIAADGSGEATVLQSTSTETCELTNLDPSVKYNVTISSVTQFDTSPPMEGSFTTLSLGGTVLTLSNATLTSLTANWEAAGGDGLTGYEIQYWLKVRPGATPLSKTVGPDILQTVLDDLQPGRVYVADAIPLYGDLTGRKGSDEAMTALPAPTPTNVRFTRISYTSACAKWNVNRFFPNANIDHYVVKYKPADGSGDEMVLRSKTKQTCDLVNLDPSVTYRVTVSCVTELDTSPPAEGEFTTLSPGSTALTLSNPTMTSITANWEPAEGVGLTGYEIGYWPKETMGSMPLVKEVGPDVLQMTLNDLQPGTMYVAVATPVFGDITGGNSTDEERTALPAPTPKRLRFSQVTHTTARAHWDVGDFPDADVDHYLVTLVAADGSGGETVIRIRGNKTCPLLNLDPSVKYNVTVSTVTKFDTSPIVEGDFTTLSLGDTVLTLSNPTLTTLKADWEAAGGHGLTGYELRYRPKQSAESESGRPPLANSQEVVARFGPEVNHTILTDLETGTFYTARVTPLHGHLFGSFGSDEETTDTLQSPVVRVVDTTLSTLQASWNDINYPVANWTATIYSDDTGEETIVEVPGNSTEYTFNNLLPSTVYNVRVEGHVIDGDYLIDSPKGSADGTTKSLVAPNVTVSEADESELTVKWENINMPVDQWTVLVYPEGRAQHVESKDVNGDVNQFTFMQLQPATVYQAEVVGHVNENEETFDSPKGEDSGMTDPAPPNNIEVINRDLTELETSFEPSRGSADGYVAECVSEIDNRTYVQSRITETASGYKVTCSEATPATPYTIYVRTIFRSVLSDSISTSATTLVPPPSEITLTQPTTHSMMVTWEPPVGYDGPVDFYTLTYNSTTGINSVQVSGDKLSSLMDDLIPDTTYDVQVEATVNGEVSQPQTSSENTLADTIELQIDDVTYTTVDISWTPSSVPGATYIVTYSALPGQNVQTEVPVEAGVQTLSLNDLLPATTYKIAVKAIYKQGVSSPSIQEATTLGVPPIGPMTFTNITDSSFIAHWGEPISDNPPSSYVVTYWTEQNPPLTYRGVPTNELLIEALEPETNYNVTVHARYFPAINSQPIQGNATTLPFVKRTCSCERYMNTQAKMQSTLIQLVQHIQVLSDRIDQLTAANRPQVATVNGNSHGIRRQRHTRRKANHL